MLTHTIETTVLTSTFSNLIEQNENTQSKKENNKKLPKYALLGIAPKVFNFKSPEDRDNFKKYCELRKDPLGKEKYFNERKQIEQRFKFACIIEKD